jgi:hypothetical protein
MHKQEFKRKTIIYACNMRFSHLDKGVIFDFEYSIHIDHYRPYRSAKRIMLRPYMDALEMIRDDNDQFPPLRLMSCKDCHIVPSIKGRPQTRSELRYDRRACRSFRQVSGSIFACG